MDGAVPRVTHPTWAGGLPPALHPTAPAHSSRRRPPSAGSVAGLLLYATLLWLVLLNFRREEIGPALDASAVAALTRAIADGARFGPELCFNYGPLAPLAVRTWDGRIFGAFFAGELVLKAAIVVGVCRLVRGTGRTAGTWAGWLLALTVFWIGAADWQALFFLATVAAGWVVAGERRLDRWLTVPALGLLAVLALVKGTLLVLATVAACTGALACARRRGNWRAAAWRVGGFGLALLGVWVAIGQRAADLPAFVRGTLDIAAGYARGMSQPPGDPGVLRLGLWTFAAAGLQVMVLAWTGRRDRGAWPLAALLGAALFLAWRQGFTRADGHVWLFFVYAVLAAGSAAAFFPAASPRLAAGVQGTACAVVLALAATGITRAGMDPAGTLWRAVRHRPNPLPILADPRGEANRARAELARSRKLYALPRIRAAVGQGTVDVFGFEQGMAMANGLRYTPAPVPQGYQANTPYTQTINQDFYRGPRAPEFVVFKLQPIDGHLPTAENAGVLATLALDYAPVLFENGYLLLRRAAPPPPAGVHPLPLGRTLAEGELDLGETMSVPPVGPEEMVWCELWLRESLRGRLRAGVYQQQPVQAEVIFDGRARPSRYRLVPGMVATGFLLSPAVDSERTLVDLQAGRPVPLVAALRLVHGADDPWLAWQFRPRWGYRLRTLPRPGGAAREGAAGALARGELGMFNDIATPGPTRVFSEVAAGSRFQVAGETFLFVHPPGEVELPVPPGATHARGRFSFDPVAWREGNPDGVLVHVDLVPPGGGAPQTLFSRLLLPATEPADREPGTFDVPLPPGAAGGRLLLRTLNNPETGVGGRGWIGWGNLRME